MFGHFTSLKAKVRHGVSLRQRMLGYGIGWTAEH